MNQQRRSLHCWSAYFSSRSDISENDTMVQFSNWITQATKPSIENNGEKGAHIESRKTEKIDDPLDLDPWHNELKVLIPKATPTSLDHYRPISILVIMFKLFMSILYALLVPFLPFGNWFQHGSNKYFQCIEVVHAIRLLIEKRLSGELPLF